MSETLFTNVSVLDGSGAAPFTGEVLVEGNRIAGVSKKPGGLKRPGAEIVDGGGATLMPGLLDAHIHLSFDNSPNPVRTVDIPPEDHALLTAKFAKLVLDHGITSAFGGASTKPRLDVAIRNAIDAGDIPGPRLLAGSQQLGPSGGFNDERLSHLPARTPTMSVCCDGPDEFRRATRVACREGVDVIKIVPSASSLAWGDGPLDEDTVMTDAEFAAVAEVAKQRGRKLAAHARSAESIRMCVRHGFDIIYHATHADTETQDALEAAKDRVFVAPSIALPITRLEEGVDTYDGPAATPRARLEAEVETTAENMRALIKRGVRVVPGGDYGFACNPHGTNARELEHFVKYFGCSPMDAVVAATSWAGELMGLPGELGLIRKGYLADILLVEGNPLDDVRILQDRENLLAIMKDGDFHKSPPTTRTAYRQAAE